MAQTQLSRKSFLSPENKGHFFHFPDAKNKRMVRPPAIVPFSRQIAKEVSFPFLPLRKIAPSFPLLPPSLAPTVPYIAAGERGGEDRGGERYFFTFYFAARDLRFDTCSSIILISSSSLPPLETKGLPPSSLKMRGRRFVAEGRRESERLRRAKRGRDHRSRKALRNILSASSPYSGISVQKRGGKAGEK